MPRYDRYCLNRFPTSKACHLIIDYRLSEWSLKCLIFYFCDMSQQNILLHVITLIHTHDEFSFARFSALSLCRDSAPPIHQARRDEKLVWTKSLTSCLNTVTRSLCFCFETRFAHLFSPIWCFSDESKLMLYLPKLTTKKIISLMNMTAPAERNEKQTWNEMIYLSTFTLQYTLRCC